MDKSILEARAINNARNSFVELSKGFKLLKCGVVQYHKEPSSVRHNLSAFPVEKVIIEHRVRALAYQHWFRFLHALTLVPRTKMKVLDIGSGDCMIGHFLYQNLRRPKYAAVDLDLKRLKAGIARGFGKEEFLFIQHDLTKKLPFPDKSFEVVIAYESIEHLEKEEASNLIDECYRVLVKNGRLSISTPNNRGEKIARKYERFKTHGKKHMFEEHPYEWGYKELKNVIRKAGFRNAYGYGLDFDNVRRARHILLEADEEDKLIKMAESIMDYFPTQISRMLLALHKPEDASFIMIEAMK